MKTSIAEKVDIIFSGAGLPLDLPSFLKKDSVTKLVPIVSSARAVRIICEKWKNNYDYLPDAVVLEGRKRVDIWDIRKTSWKTSISHWKNYYLKS